MPPETRQTQSPDGGAQTTPAASHFSITTIQKRADFLAANRGRKVHKPAFVLQARNRQDHCADIRIGFTCSRKVGNAVARNRAKRRLQAAARTVLPSRALPGWDYVLIGRRDITATQPMEELQSDLAAALKAASK